MTSNLSQTQAANELALTELVFKLEKLGNCAKDEPWFNYDSFELSEELGQLLVELIDSGWELSSNHADKTHSLSVQSHAWRIISVHKFTPGLAALINRLKYSTDDSWSELDIQNALLKFGNVAVEPIKRQFTDEIIFGEEAFGLGSLIEVLTKIAEAFPSEKHGIVIFLKNQLSHFELLPPSLNSFIIYALSDLRSTDAIDLIQKAFECDFVDLDIVDWSFIFDEFEHEIKLIKELSIPNEPFTNIDFIGQDKFQKLLHSLNCTLNPEELELMALGASLCSVQLDTLDLAKILLPETLLGDGQSATTTFQTRGQFQFFNQQLLGLLNKMTIFHNKPFALELKANAGDLFLPNNLRASMQLFRAKMKLLSFLRGIEIGRHQNQQLRDIQESEFIEYLKKSISDLETFEINQPNISKYSAEGLFDNIANYWNANYLLFAAKCR